MAYSQESRIQNLIDDLYDDREIALNKLLKINNPSLQTLISKNALLRDRVGGLTLAEWSQVQNQLKYTPSGRIRTFGAETFEASSEMNKQCVECENMVAATDGDNYFVCDACVERMGAEGEGKTRTFKITNITYDTYDEEAEEHQTQEDLELPTEMVVQIELQGDEEEWEIYDLLTYQIENQGYGWLVESFDFDTESKSAEDYEAEQKKLHPGLYRYKGKIGLRKGWTECQECDDLVKLNDINWYYIAGYGQATVCDVCVGKYNYKKDRLSKGHKHGELALLMFMKEDREAKEKMWKEQLIEPDSDHEHPDGDYGERMGISEDYVIQPFEGEDLEFTDWANQETKHHGKTSLKDWADHEIKKHGGKMSFQDWAKHEDKSHIDRYGAERVFMGWKQFYQMHLDDGMDNSKNQIGNLWNRVKDMGYCPCDRCSKAYYGAEEYPCDGCGVFSDSLSLIQGKGIDTGNPIQICSRCSSQDEGCKICEEYGDCESDNCPESAEYEENGAEELKRDSCCCGATKTHPCACMIQGIETCSATCPCSLEKKGAESMGDDGMRYSPHKLCPDCGATPTSAWIDPGRCECGRVMNPSQYTNISFGAETAGERVRRWQREYYLMSRRLMIICRKCNPDGDSGPFLEMRDGTIICPRCEDELYLPGDPVWDEFGAENWGGDPEGKLAQALAKARKKAKKVGKTLKIEKLGAETSGAKAEREDSWEKGVIRLAISDGCFSDEYAEWVLRQIDGPYATMNHPRFEGISYWDKVISQAETSGQWEIGEQLEEAQMNAEEWVCSCEEGEDCEDTCTVCENCGVRTITAHTPFADEEDWPNREERVKAAKGKYTWYEDKGCDYCGEWIPEEAGWKHDLEGVFVPRIEMKSFKRAEDEPTCPECGKEETWDIENYICEDCGYVDCDICGMGLEINEHPESSSAMVSLDGSGFETEAYLAWNNMNQVCKLCYEDVIEPQYDGWGKCNTCGRNHPPNPHYDGRYGNEQASHHKEWCKEHKNYPQEDLTDKIRQRDEELERQEKEWAVKREKKRLRLEKWKKDREDEIKSMGWLKRKWYGLAESNDCPFCSGKIDFEEAYIELPRSLCEGCYDAVMEKRHDHAYSAESFSAPTKGIDTFTKPFEEMALDNSIGKSIVVGFVIGGLALFGYNKWK